MRRLLAGLALAALVAACSDQPTQPSDDAAVPTVTFMKTTNAVMPPGNGWTLLYQSDPVEWDPATSPWLTPDHPCLGPGVSVQYLKWWWWTKDFVVTPSGNAHATQALTWTDAGYVAPNGEIWEMQKMVQPLIARFDRDGSEWVAQNPGEIWYVNLTTGVRMKETAKNVLRFANYPEPPGYPSYTGWDAQQWHCQLMGK